MKYILLGVMLIATSTAVMAKNDKEKHNNKGYSASGNKDAAVYAVPDAGSTALLLGVALGGLGLLRKTW